MPPDTKVDRYTLLGVIGEGGMAEVYKARHDKLGTLHAIKVLKLPHQSIQERLLVEGRVQAQLNHPNVVSVTDVIEVEGAPGLVMEFIDGVDLDVLIRTESFTLGQIDRIGRGILAGVSAAHSHGMIHRDLKPANILMSKVDGEWVPKITDFGLVKLLAQEATHRTRSGVAMGTPSYMAPEQIRSAADVDARADIFSLGAILYELVGGERAFDGEDVLEIFNKVASAEFTPIHKRAPKVPRRMRTAIEGSMRSSKEDRIQDVKSLLSIWSTESALPPPPVAAAEGPGRVWWFGLVAMVALLMMVIGLGGAAGLGVALYGTSTTGPAGAPVPPPVPTTEPIPVPVDPVPSEPVVPPAPIPEIPESPVPATPAPTAAPVPTTAPVPTVKQGNIVVTGDARRVFLVAGKVRHAPGVLPAGSYTLTATFATGESAVHQVEIRAGRTLRMNCDSNFTSCLER